MKDNRAAKNIITNILVQIILAVSGFILPRFILEVYGSSINGMINSISQFLTYAGLVEMGIGNAAIVALYKPIADENQHTCNLILATVKKKYIRSGILYTVLISMLALFYPLAVKGQIEYSFAFAITMIIALSGTIDYFVLGKYKVLLIADRKYYILNLVRGMTTCLLIIGSIILLVNRASLFIVKGLAVVIHLTEALLIKCYIQRKYPNANYGGNEIVALEQQNPALVHQVCMTIVYNTDLVVLTLFQSGNSLKEISVYTVYAMAFSMIRNMVSTMTGGINASFGDLFANNRKRKVQEVFKQFELVYFMILFILYSLFVVLIVPFVKCYTKGIIDVDYIRYSVGLLFGLTGLLSQIKDVSGIVVYGAGHYRQTQGYAIAEAVVNIITSILLVKKYGIIGVLVGTLISHIVMDIGIITYAAKNFVQGSIRQTGRRLIRNCVIMWVLCYIDKKVVVDVNNWAQWMRWGIFLFLGHSAIFILMNLAFEKECRKELFKRLKKYLSSIGG